MLRKIFFWTHFVVGLAIGLGIFIKAVTGMMLAFEPQLTDRSEAAVQRVTIMAGSPRLGLDALIAAARDANPAQTPGGITIASDPAISAVVNFGRTGGIRYVNPYTGTVLGGGSRTRAFFRQVENFHRWFGIRNPGQAVSGAVTIGFTGLLLSGIYLWWPRSWGWRQFTAAATLRPKLKGKARDWNWHTVGGFWAAPLILIVTVTGIVMAYPWANDALFRLTGNEPPPRQAEQRPPAARDGRAPGGSEAGANRCERNANAEPVRARTQRDGERADKVSAQESVAWNEIWNHTLEKAGKWESISFRLPARAGGPVTASVVGLASWGPAPRSQLTMNAQSGEVTKWEPASGANAGRKLRAWVRPLHTGEAGGILGEALAFLVTAIAAVLVWTGFALAWRRFFGKRPEALNARPSSPTEPRPLEDVGVSAGSRPRSS